MANLFNITTTTGNIVLDASRTGKVSFTVTNTSSSPVRSNARVTAPDPTTLPWFTIEGQSSQILNPATTEQITVQIAVPSTAASKEYIFALLMVDENLPDENFTEGPLVKVWVPEPIPVAPPKPFPWCIVAAGAAILVALIVGGVVIATRPGAPTPTPVPVMIPDPADNDRTGADIYIPPPVVGSFAACEALCLGVNACKSITFYPPASLCFLKSSVPPLTAKPGLQSAVKGS